MNKPQRDKYLARCRTRIQSAKKFRESEKLDKKWSRLSDMYTGKQFDKIPDQEDRIAVNLVFANVNTIWAATSTNYPKVNVHARRPDEADAAVIVDATVNYWWRTKPFKPEIQTADKESLIVGHGWVKTGWRYVEEQQNRHPNDIQAEMQQRQGQVDQYAADNPDLAASLPTDEQILSEISMTETVAVEDGPFVERVDPHDVFVDPEATSPRDMRWIAQRILRPIEEVKNDKKYKSARSGVTADYEVDATLVPDNVKKDKEFKRCSIYEYYDLVNGTMCIFSEKGDDFLVDPTPQPYSFGHPFVYINNYEVPGQFYGMGEIEAIEDLQNELNKTRSQMLNHRKRGARKWLGNKRAFNQQGIAAITSDIDGQIAWVNDDIPFNEALVQIPMDAIDPGLYNWSETIEADMDTISGVSEYQRGGASQQIRRSATEASIIAEASNSRAADKLARFELVNAEIARRVVMLAQQYMTNDESIRINGQDGLPIWGNVEPDFIKGEFDFEVEAGSTKPKNEAYMQQQATQLFTALQPLLGSPFVNTPELLKLFIEQGFGIKDASKYVAQQPQMMPPGMPGQPPQGGPGQPMPQNQGPPPGQPPVDPAALQQLVGQVGYPPQGAIPNG